MNQKILLGGVLFFGAHVCYTTGRTADELDIHYAAEVGSARLVSDFLWQGAEVNRRDAKLRTPLHYAAIYGHKDVIKVLLESSGIEVDSKDTLGNNAAFYAKQAGHQQIVTMLKKQQMVTLLKVKPARKAKS